MRAVLCAVSLMWALLTYADAAVSDVKVFSGYPWKEVVVGYTITGMAAQADIIQLTATDKSTNKTYTALSLTDAALPEGRHVLRWSAAVEGAKFSSTNVVFSVSIVDLGAVQLWANGPYWAECNVGATKPEEHGYYFWWGDTVGYKRREKDGSWVSVANGVSFAFFSGYCPTYNMSVSQLRSAGYIDATGNLVAAHDVARAHLGVPWRMPTDAEFSALINNCDTEWTKRNGVSGRLVKGRGAYASKSIFLPAAGYGVNNDLNDFGSYGSYWSSTHDDYFGPRRLYFDYWGDFNTTFNDGPYYGRSVRPVRGFAK